MTFHLQTDKNPFQFHIIYIGMNPLKKDAATRTKEEIESSRCPGVSCCLSGALSQTSLDKSQLQSRLRVIRPRACAQLWSAARRELLDRITGK